MAMKSARRAVAVPIACALVLAACGDDDEDTSAGGSDTTPATEAGSATTAGGEATTPAVGGGGGDAGRLAGICPETLVIQTDWFPEAEHGALYQLVGDDYTVDTETKVVRGSLVGHDGADSGIDIEVRTGGPATGYQGPAATMYTDESIHLGYSYTVSAADFATVPLIQVVAPLEKNPQMIMWNPEAYPDVKTIDDLAAAGVTVNVFSKDVMSLFIAEGRYPDELVDPSYDGSPARFISEGDIAQQGFASAEPYLYENTYEEWGKPIAYQLLFDAGYQDYSQTLGVKPDQLETLRPCLEQFVPMVQQAAVDYIESPDRANAIIVDAVEQFADFWVYRKELADFSVATQKELGLVSNGPDGTLGNFDMARVQEYIDKMIASGNYDDLPEDFKAETMVTNEFIDPSIGL